MYIVHNYSLLYRLVYKHNYSLLYRLVYVHNYSLLYRLVLGLRLPCLESCLEMTEWVPLSECAMPKIVKSRKDDG